MGRTADTFAQWQGQGAEVMAHLEAGEVVLRGGIRDRVPRASITRMTVEGGWLTLATHRGPLVLELGEAEAARWLVALQKPAPSLAMKLGVGPECRAFVLGPLVDTELAAALAGLRAASVKEAGVLLAVLEAPEELDAAFALAQKAPHLMIWCVHPKGKAAVTDAEVRAYFRDRGYGDSKSCAVSDRLTATRYGLRKDT